MIEVKINIPHPTEFLAPSIIEVIRLESGKAELDRNLTDVQRHQIHQHQWYNMYVPKEFGGLELSLPEILRIEEGLSYADGSTGWVVTLCSGAAWFVGFLDLPLAKETFENDQVCFAGSGAITGIANKATNGYEVHGYWKYATGSLHATVYTANCRVQENGAQLYHDDGSPVVKSFLFKKDEVIVHSTWSSMGMIATGSHAIEVKNVLIPLNRAFIIQPAQAKLKHPIFQNPFLQLAETTLAINLSGMACRFMDLCDEIFSKKDRKDLYLKLQDCRTLLNGARSDFYQHTDATWETLISKSCIPDSMLQHVSHLSHQLVRFSRDLVNVLYSYCGLEAADTRTEINRVWRNFHTAGQHSLFSHYSKPVQT